MRLRFRIINLPIYYMEVNDEKIPFRLAQPPVLERSVEITKKPKKAKESEKPIVLTGIRREIGNFVVRFD